jgi:hypothetical protein
MSKIEQTILIIIIVTLSLVVTSCSPPPLRDNSPTAEEVKAEKEQRRAELRKIDAFVKIKVAEMLED